MLVSVLASEPLGTFSTDLGTSVACPRMSVDRANSVTSTKRNTRENMPAAGGGVMNPDVSPPRSPALRCPRSEQATAPRVPRRRPAHTAPRRLLSRATGDLWPLLANGNTATHQPQLGVRRLQRRQRWAAGGLPMERRDHTDRPSPHGRDVAPLRRTMSHCASIVEFSTQCGPAPTSRID